MYGVLYTVIKRYFEKFCFKHKDFLLDVPTTALHMLQSRIGGRHGIRRGLSIHWEYSRYLE